MLILAGLVFALLQSPPDSSVRSNLSISGVITDSTSALIPGVVVFIKSEDLLEWTITDESGRYRLANLKSGRYELIVALPGFSIRKRSVNLTTPTTQDEILEVSGVGTCACVGAVPPSSDQLRAAADRLRQVALRMEDLRPGADLDAQRRQLLSDYRSMGSWAIAELKDALDKTDTQVRVNAAVLLFDLFSRGYADNGYVSQSLARAATDADPTLRRYALVTLDSALKTLK